DLDLVPAVMKIAALVPDSLSRLHGAAAVRGAGEEPRLALRLRRPPKRPEPPREWVVLRIQFGLPPCGPVVVGQLDLRDVRRAREGEAANRHGRSDPGVVWRLGDVGLHE